MGHSNTSHLGTNIFPQFGGRVVAPLHHIPTSSPPVAETKLRWD